MSERSSGDLRPARQHGIHSVIGQAAPDLLNQLSSLNPLRTTNGPRNTSTRGKPATPITLSDLPPVKKTDFDPYLTELSTNDLYQNYLDSIARPLTNDKTAVTRGKLPDLNGVPSLYMQPDFDLSLPRIFDAVTSLATLDNDKKLSIGDLATDQMLQERLSHYLDIVEQHLASEIAHRSASFFSALSNLQSLNAQSEMALDRAAALKKELVQVDERTAKKGLAVTRAGLRRRRLQDVAKAIERLKEIWRALDQAEELTQHGEWEGALGIVEELSTAYTQDAPVRLNKIHALDQIPEKLSTLRKQIGKSLQMELIGVLVHELEEQAARSSEGVEAFKVKEQASDRTRPLIRGLVRCGHGSVEEAVEGRRMAVLGTVKKTIKQNLPGSDISTTELDDLVETPSSKSAISTRLKDEPPDAFLTLLKSIYSQLLIVLEIIHAHNEVLAHLIEDAQKNQASQDKSASAIESNLQDIVFAAAELANVRCSKLLTARAEETSKLSLADFVKLFEESWNFVLKCEVICKRMIVGLRGTIVSQAKSFLQQFHQANVSLSAKFVEEEQWTVVDVPASTQHIIQLIIEGAVSNPAELVLKGDKLAPATQNGTASEKQIDIEGRQFFAVSACLKFLDSLVEYLKVVINVPLLTTDAMSKIIEFLKQFNSRTCQVVLGAGAMRSAGLKNITAKHLALASQCLSILISLIPYIRELLRRHLNPKQAVMLVEFDKLKRDYQEHQNEIFSKLVSIMGDRLTVHCKSLQAADWTKAPPGPANSYMEALLKETTTLHKVLTRYMPGEPLELVMMQVMSAITTRLAEEYGKLELPDDAAKENVLKDARYLKTRLGELKGLERAAPGSDIEELVKSLQTKQPKPEPPPKVEVETPPPTPTKTGLVTAKKKQSPPAEKSAAALPPSNVKNRLGALFSRPMRRTPSGSVIPPDTKDDAESASVNGNATASIESMTEEKVQAANGHTEPVKEDSALMTAEPDTPLPLEVDSSGDQTEKSEIVQEVEQEDLAIPSQRTEEHEPESRLEPPSIIQQTESTDDLSLITPSQVDLEPSEAMDEPTLVAEAEDDSKVELSEKSEVEELPVAQETQEEANNKEAQMPPEIEEQQSVHELGDVTMEEEALETSREDTEDSISID